MTSSVLAADAGLKFPELEEYLATLDFNLMPTVMERSKYVRAGYEESYRAALKSAEEAGEEVLTEVQRQLCRSDLYFLAIHALEWRHFRCDWGFVACKMVEWDPYGCLDLWAREHYKTSTISIARTIQEVLIDPEITIAIFSFSSKLAQSILSPIAEELLNNDFLKGIFPDILWQEKPDRNWSIQDGIQVHRRSRRRERTIEAWGLIDSQPVGKHYDIRKYDDIITEKEVNTVEMVKKAMKAWELSLSLGVSPVPGVSEGGKEAYIGTRYRYDDPYSHIIKRGIVRPRIIPGEYKDMDGQWTGVGPLWDEKTIQGKRKSFGPSTYASQILQDPASAEKKRLQREDLRRWDNSDLKNLNLYILSDPAGERKKGSDNSALAVIGYGADDNYYLVDMVRRQMGQLERKDQIFHWVKKYEIQVSLIEAHGKDSEILFIEDYQDREHFHFPIVKIADPTPKNDRIADFIDLCKGGRFFFPHEIPHVNTEGEQEDLMEVLIEEELLRWPFVNKDDGIDVLAHITRPAAKENMVKPRLSMDDNLPGLCDSSMDYFDDGSEPW